MARVSTALHAGILSIVVAIGVGCGSKFELPTESPHSVIPGENSYSLKYRWEGFGGAVDVLMTRAAQVYVAEPLPGSDSLRVRGYIRSKATPTTTGVVMPGLAFPVRLAEGASGALFVLDDTTPPFVKRFSADARTQVGSFTDPDWREAVNDTTLPDNNSVRVTNSLIVLRGLAADSQNNVYVAWSDSIFHEDFDIDSLRNPIDSTRTFSTEVADFIRKYTGDGTPLLDIATRGSGTGFVDNPGGLATADEDLFFADVAKNWVQKVRTNLPSSPIFHLDGLDLEEDPGFLKPLDVAVDDSGSIYVVDTGKARVLKFDAEGTFDLRVDIPFEGGGGPTATVEPIAVTVGTSLALVLDRALGMVFIYELRAGQEKAP